MRLKPLIFGLLWAIALTTVPLNTLAGTSRATPADSLVSTDGTKSWALTGTAGPVISSTGIVQEAPTGTINSSNVTFTLSATPGAAATLVCFLDGQAQTLTTDYTRSGATITETTAPATGQILVCQYSKN